MARWSAIVVLALAACSRPSDDGKKLQDLPPPREVAVPPGLAIEVAVDGNPRPPITSDTLRATHPDFSDEEHRAWRIPTLVDAAAAPGAVVEASAASGPSVRFARDGGLEPVLFLTRRSELIVEALDPKEPFPRFHGRGGRLHRPGDQAPRVMSVARIAVTRPAPR